MLSPKNAQDNNQFFVDLSRPGTSRKPANIAVSEAHITPLLNRSQTYLYRQQIALALIAMLLLAPSVAFSDIHKRMLFFIVAATILLLSAVSYQIADERFLFSWRIFLVFTFFAIIFFQLIGAHTALKIFFVEHSSMLTPIFIVCCILNITTIYAKDYNSPPIRSDGVGYYLYLPSYILYHDLSFTEVAKKQFNNNIPDSTGVIHFDATDRYLNKYSTGVALLMLPSFVVGHMLTFFTSCKPDGFSWCYQYSIASASMFYVAIGLTFLRKTLSVFFSAGVALATTIIIVLGTNLLHYATYDSVFSHGFSFCFFSILIYATIKWYKDPSLRHSIVLASTYAFIVLIRIPNAISLLFIVLFGIQNIQDVHARRTFFFNQRRNIFVMLIVFMLILTPQLLIYKYTTGTWFINAYQKEGFNFTSPHIFDVLFSVQKGLFFWSPILFLSVLGLFYLRKQQQAFLLPISIFMIVNTYLIASWHHWQYGGSYGHRAFTDSLAFMAVPMAAWYQSLRQRWLVVLVRALVPVLILLSLVQMVQYWRGIIPFDGTTFELYTKIFLRFAS